MFRLIVIALFAIVGMIGINLSNEDLIFTGQCILYGSVLWFIISIIIDFTYYSSQLARFEELRASLKQVDIYRKMQTELMVEFKKYLGEKYPELEERIFKNINESKGDMHVILKFPELKSSKTILKLTHKINKLAANIYELQDRIEDDCADIRYYKNGKWEIIKPSIPNELKEVVYRKS